MTATDVTEVAVVAGDGGECRVVFTPSGIEVRVAAGAGVLDAARAGGVDLDSVCGGRGICGRCQVAPSPGRHAKWGIDATVEALTAPGPTEQGYRGRRPVAPGNRLGCQAAVLADVVIDVPAASQVRRPIVRKTIDLGDVVLDPVVSLHYLELPPVALGDEVSDAERVMTALATDWGLDAVAVPLGVLADLHAAIAAGEGSVTAVVHSGRSHATGTTPPTVPVGWAGAAASDGRLVEPDVRAEGGAESAPAIDPGGRAAESASAVVPDGGEAETAAAAGHGGGAAVAGAVSYSGRRLLALRPGYAEGAWGIAIDIGSTTLAGYLLDLATGEVVTTAGRMNPQIRFGEDLMSRVSYVMMNPGGDAELTAAVRGALDELVGELCETAAVPRSHIHDVVIVGNPIMHHLVLGLDPTPLGAAPFTLAVRTAVEADAAAIGLGLPYAALYVAPCIAGHVGADSAAATLAEGPHRVAEPQLLVDVGTNAEIVLGDRRRTFAASSPTGPAFEGAQLSCGQRATAGAVERVRIDPDTLEPRLKVIGCDVWSDDPGFAEALGDLQISGVCGSGIIDVIAEMYLAGIIDRNGVVQGALAARNPRITADGRTFAYELQAEPVQLRITQNDVRAIQLAKAALRAGIDLLLEHAGISAVADIRLAGAFGAHIDPLRALVLGLVPDAPVEGVRSVGNASGAGAARLLVSGAQRVEIEHVSEQITKIETATEARFQELFVAAMAFPHDTAPTPHLAQLVDLPTPPPSSAAPGPDGSGATPSGPQRRRRRARSR